MKYITIATIIGVSIASLAQVNVDDFSTPQGPITQSGAIGSMTDMATGAGILGSERTIRVTLANASGSATSEVTGGNITFVCDQDADLEVWWDGDTMSAFNTTGLGGVDLTQSMMQDRLTINVNANDNTGANMGVTVYTDGSNSSEHQFTMPSSGSVELMFSNFNTLSGAGADFTNVGLVFFRTIDRVGARSFSLSFLESTPVELVEFSVQ